MQMLHISIHIIREKAFFLVWIIAYIQNFNIDAKLYIFLLQTKTYIYQAMLEIPQKQCCPFACTCEKCITLGFTLRVALQDPGELIYKGPIMNRLPVSQFYHMQGIISLTYSLFHKCPIGDIVKLKSTFCDFMPGLSRIYMTINPKDRKEEILVNKADNIYWFVHLVRAKMYCNYRYGIPYGIVTREYDKKIVGRLWIKRFFQGWVQTGVEITEVLRIESQNQIRKIKEFWTSFEIIDKEGLCLVVKFWDLFTKWQVGIPLKQLGMWLAGFLSLLKD